ncbi:MULTISPECIES: RICIN domain-containing protein [Streptomyces]|uniref:Ricin B lectin domain-containing protein n=1 Tax=Streptomyces luteosporeus TaxID=173856 RepID=A0ABN3U0A5_9ACTN
MARITRAALALGASIVVLSGGALTAHADTDDPSDAAKKAAEAAYNATQAAVAGAQEAKNRAAMPETLVRLQAAHSGKCLTIEDGKTADGVKATQAACTEGKPQEWRMVPTAGSSYQLRSAASGKCLEIEGSGTQLGADAQQWKCIDGAKQMRWQVVLVDPVKKLFQLRPTHAEDRCLDIPEGSKADGAMAQSWSCNQTPAQLWKIAPANVRGPQ